MPVSQVETLVVEHLAKQDLERIANGFRFKRKHGTTDLTFRPSIAPAGDFGLISIASVETRFAGGVPTLTAFEIERLNRRAVYGNFFQKENIIHMKLSFSIYEKETAAHWIMFFLLEAFGAQLACGVGIAQSEISEELLRYNRSNLEFPRKWPKPFDPNLFSEAADWFNKVGYVATTGSHGMILEVPLATGGRARFLDPTSETALLHVVVDVPHPTAGVGHLCTIALPFDPPRHEGLAWCTRLNALEHEQEDFVPKMGAWGLRGIDNQVVYSLFLPATDKFTVGPGMLMNWMLQRTLWVRDRFWTAGEGLRQKRRSHE